MSRPRVFNLSLHDKDEEYRQRLPSQVDKIMVQLRGNYDMRLAFEQGAAKGTGPFILISSGAQYVEDGIPSYHLADLPINVYLRCADADHQVAEILVWFK